MLAFVITHLSAHSLLLISLPFAQDSLVRLMQPWRSGAGTLRPPRCLGKASDRVAFQRQRMGNIGASSSACTSTSRTVLLFK